MVQGLLRLIFENFGLISKYELKLLVTSKKGVCLEILLFESRLNTSDINYGINKSNRTQRTL